MFRSDICKNYAAFPPEGFIQDPIVLEFMQIHLQENSSQYEHATTLAHTTMRNTSLLIKKEQQHTTVIKMRADNQIGSMPIHTSPYRINPQLWLFSLQSMSYHHPLCAGLCHLAMQLRSHFRNCTLLPSLGHGCCLRLDPLPA